MVQKYVVQNLTATEGSVLFNSAIDQQGPFADRSLVPSHRSPVEEHHSSKCYRGEDFLTFGIFMEKKFVDRFTKEFKQ